MYKTIRNTACVLENVARSPGCIWLTADITESTLRPSAKPLMPWQASNVCERWGFDELRKVKDLMCDFDFLSQLRPGQGFFSRERRKHLFLLVIHHLEVVCYA